MWETFIQSAMSMVFKLPTIRVTNSAGGVDAPPLSLRYSALHGLEVVHDSLAGADCQFRRGHHLN